MNQDVRVASISVDTKPGELDDNLQKIQAWANQAANQGAQLAMFQELSLTGFIPNHPIGDHNVWLRAAMTAGSKMAITLESRALQKLSEIARRHEMLLSVGMLEDAGNLLHNTQVLVDKAGLIGFWRKMHIPMFEMPFYVGGGCPNVVDTRLGRIGANICFDALLPESTRLLAIQNVEIVLFPFAADPPPVTAQGWFEWAHMPVRSRCIENAVFGIASNYVGHVECAGATQDFPGGGMIVDPRGVILSQWNSESGQPAMTVGDLSHSALVASRNEPEYLFRFRRPELYAPLSHR